MSYEIRNSKLLREAYEAGRRQSLNEQIDPSGGAVMWPRLISGADGVYLWQNEDGSFYVEGRGIQTRPFKSLDDAWEFYRYHVMRRGGEDPGEIPPTIDNPFAQNAPTKQVHQQQVPIRSDVPTSFREAYESGRRQSLNEQSGDNHLAVYYITWLLSQGLITQEQYLEFYDAIAAGNADWILISGMFGQYVRKFLQDHFGSTPLSPLPPRPGWHRDAYSNEPPVLPPDDGPPPSFQEAYEAGRRQGLNESLPKTAPGYYYDPARDQSVPNPPIGFEFEIPFGPVDPTDYNDGVPPWGYDYWDGRRWRKKFGPDHPLG